MNKSKLAKIGILFMMMLVLAGIGFAQEDHAIITIKVGEGSGWDDNWGANLLPNYYYTWDSGTERWYRTQHNPKTDPTLYNWRHGEVMSFGGIHGGAKYITHNIDGGFNDDGTVQYITARVTPEGSASWDSDLTWAVGENEQLDRGDKGDMIQANAEVTAAYHRRANSIQQELHPITSENGFPIMSVRLRSSFGTIDEWGTDLVHNAYYTWDQEQGAWYQTMHDPKADTTAYNWRHGTRLSGDRWSNLEEGTRHIAFNIDGGGIDQDGRVRYITAEVSTEGSPSWDDDWSKETAQLDDVYKAAQTQANADMKSAFHKRRGQVEQHTVAETKVIQTEIDAAIVGTTQLSSDQLRVAGLTLGEAGTVQRGDKTLSVDTEGNVVAYRNLNEIDVGADLEDGELAQLRITPGQEGIATLPDGSTIRVDGTGRVTVKQAELGFVSGAGIDIVSIQATGTGIGGAAPGMLHYYNTVTGQILPVPESRRAEAAAFAATIKPITQDQLEAVTRGKADHGTVSYNEGSGKFSIAYTREEGGITTTRTDLVGADGVETKTTERTVGERSITIVRDAENNIQRVTGPGDVNLGTSENWGLAIVENEGVLTYSERAVKEYKEATADRTAVIEMADGGVISFVEGGSVELTADGQKVIITIDGQDKPQELTPSEYQQLTGLDPKAGVPVAARGSIRNLQQVQVALQDALGREDIGLSDLVGTDIQEEGTAYWTDSVRIVISPDGETVTSTKGDFNPEGNIKPGSSYELTRKHGGKITMIRTGTVDEEGRLGDPETISTSIWNHGPGNTGTARIAGEYLNFQLKPGTNDIEWYEFGGKYYRVEDGTWFKDEEFTELCEGVCIPDNALTNALRKADDAKAAKEGRETSTVRKVQRFWGFLEASARGGIGRVFGLLMSDEKLAEWRETVDETLCKTIIAGGTECWQSKACSIHVDNRVGGGQVYAETPAGMLTLAVHVEGEVSILETPEGTEYLYKFTYNVNNPKDGQIGFNIQLSGDRTTNLYSDNIILEGGGSHSRLGSSAVVQYSTNYYNKICVVFTGNIEIVGDKISQVCNKITEYAGAAAAPSVGQPALHVNENQI